LTSPGWYGDYARRPTTCRPLFFGAGTAWLLLETPGKETVADEAHVPAEQSPSEADAWLPRPHGDTRRAKRAETAASQGPEAADRPGATEVRAAIVSALAASARIVQELRSGGGRRWRIEVRKGPPSTPEAGILAGAAARQTKAERELPRRFPPSIIPRIFAVWIQRQPPSGQRGGAQPSEATSSGIRAPSPARSATGARFRRDRQARRSRTLLCRAGHRAA
jgi:hypothetical protein